ncbi:DUF1949 domain-containing protein, partial [Clostridioides difficile]|uniref:DUF1949 domain-containing protein n=1 Tax=Clostridioides difficile TaxID=1496 RepID=UPI003F8D38BF
YEDNVEIVVYSRLEDVEKLSEKMIDITSGTGKIVLGEEFYLSPSFFTYIIKCIFI